MAVGGVHWRFCQRCFLFLSPRCVFDERSKIMKWALEKMLSL